jgi:hypothetical protein
MDKDCPSCQGNISHMDNEIERKAISIQAYNGKQSLKKTS